jgi:shikimate kinase
VVLVYITGLPGSGKSTVCETLTARGYAAIDGDEQLGVWLDRRTKAPVADPPAFGHRSAAFYEQHSWHYKTTEVTRLSQSYAHTVCFIGGFAGNEDDIIALVDAAVFLQIDPTSLEHRILTRTNGPFATASDDARRAQAGRVLPHVRSQQAAWLSKGVAAVGAGAAPATVADEILARIGAIRPSTA